MPDLDDSCVETLTTTKAKGSNPREQRLVGRRYRLCNTFSKGSPKRRLRARYSDAQAFSAMESGESEKEEFCSSTFYEIMTLTTRNFAKQCEQNF